MSHTVRPATAEDAAPCAEIVNDWIDRTDWMPRAVSREVIAEMIAKGIPLREFWVVGDPVAGYLSFNAETQQIMGLYTAAPGSGHGKALMDRVKDGREFLFLRSHAANTKAHRFYEREGFRTTDTNLMDGADGIPEIRMEWRR